MEAGGFEPLWPVQTNPCKSLTKAQQKQHKSLQIQTLTKILKQAIFNKSLHSQNSLRTLFYIKSVPYVCPRICPMT